MMPLVFKSAYHSTLTVLPAVRLVMVSVT